MRALQTAHRNSNSTHKKASVNTNTAPSTGPKFRDTHLLRVSGSKSGILTEVMASSSSSLPASALETCGAEDVELEAHHSAAEETEASKPMAVDTASAAPCNEGPRDSI